jgi:DNA polymerase I-like protein with 3'-5' exonuclease and polymerase domains
MMQLPLFEEHHEPDREALARCLQASAVAVDVETETRWPGIGPRVDYGLSYAADITVIALAWQTGGELTTTVLASPFDASIRDFLRQLFDPARLIIAHNAVFDLRQLSRLTDGLIPERIWDTQSMARLLSPAVDASYSLLAVARALGLHVPERQAELKGQRGKLHTLPLELTLQYAQDDAKLAYEIYLRQLALPQDAELVEWECRALREYAAMAARGIRLNIPFVEARLETLRREREILTTRLSADGLLTPGSAQARARYLYHTKKLPLPIWSPRSPYFTRAGRRRLSAQPGAQVELSDLSTRSDVIETYMEEGSPYLEPLRDLSAYLDVDWLISTLEGLLDHAVTDGRLHSLVTIATESGRRASSYPHMQNWKMPAMAGVAIGDEGFTLVEIDYRNAENVMAAFLSGDDNLAAACAAEDFHATMAAQYFGEAWEQADADERKRLRNLSKKITYGTSYGMGAERLGESIGVSRAEAQRLMAAKDRAFAKVARMRSGAQAQVRETNRLKLWTGRPVAVPTPFVAWNYLCQGGVSEMLKRAIVVVGETYRARRLRSRVALDMHDALILEVAHDEWDEALRLASEIMESVTPEHLRMRTNPPIRFVAQPDLAENARKWGAEQWQPGG